MSSTTLTYYSPSNGAILVLLLDAIFKLNFSARFFAIVHTDAPI